MTLREAAGVPPDCRHVVVDGVDLAVSRQGEGPTVVCMHAIGHGGRDFAHFAKALEHRFEIVRVDWPGHGRSGADREPASAGRYAALLEGVLDQCAIESPILFGCSIGGAAALICAGRRPVRAIVLCNSGGLFPINATAKRFCGALARFFAAGARGAWWYRWAFAAYMRLVLPSPAAAAQRRRIARSCYETAEVIAQAWRSFPLASADIRAPAAALDVPIWVAWAAGDRIAQLKFALPAIADLKRGTLTKFEGGHAAFLEQPKAFAERFTAFADSIAA